VTQDLQRELSSCRTLTQNVEAESIFVGRYDYNSFIINTPMLYFLRPELPPATRYISDEPGLQNDCGYGKEIAEELDQAAKPMLALLEILPQNPEPNKTTTMVFCKKIEDFLASESSRLLGKCESYGTWFDVRIYGEEEL
jgi:hypothetical protein